jgi:hypothetical protein
MSLLSAVRSMSKAASAARSACRSDITCGRFGLPSSSSPSTRKTMFAGRSETRRADASASKKEASEPLELAAPLATMLGPAPDTLAVTVAKGGEVQPGSSAGWTSYIPYRKSVGPSPPTRPRTAGCPEVVMISAFPPAASIRPATNSAPASMSSSEAETVGHCKKRRIVSRCPSKSASICSQVLVQGVVSGSVPAPTSETQSSNAADRRFGHERSSFKLLVVTPLQIPHCSHHVFLPPPVTRTLHSR